MKANIFFDFDDRFIAPGLVQPRPVKPETPLKHILQGDHFPPLSASVPWPGAGVSFMIRHESTGGNLDDRIRRAVCGPAVRYR